MSTAPPPERPDEEPGEPAALSDEQWEAFLGDAAEGGATGAPKEPSARARMVTRRLRDEAEARARAEGRPGRTARSGRARGRDRTARAATPRGRRTGPAWQELDGRASRRRRVATTLGLVLVAVAVVAVRTRGFARCGESACRASRGRRDFADTA
ncbi:hypothetical protein ABZX39_29285 [Streptomyces collinus]|uniref:hypothetical protein n=1 Tax=Streptomyces collinus TaxID=42684 RepID=UPI0033BD4C93